MNKSFEATLWVNNAPVELIPFVEELLARTVTGTVSALKGAEDIEGLELYLEQGDVRVVVNGNELPITPFPNDIIANTVVGMVSALKGMGKIDSLKIEVKVR